MQSIINLPPLHDPAKTKRQRAQKIVLALLLVIVLMIGGFLVLDELAMRRLDATSVTLVEDLKIKFGQPARVSNFVAELQGSMVNDFEIDTEKLGSQEITFEYINSKNRRRKRTFTIEVVDTTKPKVYGSMTYSVPVGYEGDLTDLMLSGDDLDDHPEREIVGEYDLNQPGDYSLKYVVTDASGNRTEWPFILYVFQPQPNADALTSTPAVPEKLALADVIKTYKTPRTQVGIDVSVWQGEIDWSKVKAAGVEFVFLRLGYQDGYDGECALDKNFRANIEGALGVGLPVGVYFYSYANSIDQAKQQANWVIEQIKDYDVALGVAYDWENWSTFNAAGVSFWTLNQTAKTFLDTVNAAGYKGLLYGSKNYLDAFWNLPDYDKWLAQYYDRPTYTGKFEFWQMSDQGEVDGIEADVDLDIRYLEHH